MDDDMPPDATAVSLPEDVVFDILYRTPLKSVCRFQCVSKGWRHLISSPAFLAAHKSRHTEPFLVDTGRFRGNNTERPDLRLMDMDGNIVRVFQGVGGFGVLPTTSLDDLVCVNNGYWKGGPDARGSRDGVHVVDPATGEVLFTSPGHEEIKHPMHSITVTDYYRVFGIGRAAPSGVYKVVRVVHGDTCDVLTLGDDSGWRRKTRARSVPNYSLSLGSSSTTINGVMYFLTDRAPASDSTLLCFDLESERWKDNTIEGPECSKSTLSLYITELNGSLCMVQDYTEVLAYQPFSYSWTDVWVLDDFDKNNWSKLYTIPMGPIGRCCVPLRMLHGGEKLLVQCGTTYKKSSLALQVYDPRTEKFSNITGEPGYLPSNIALCNLHLERLVSIKS